MTDKERTERPSSNDDTIYAYHGIYKLDYSCVVEIPQTANDTILQLENIEKGLIEVFVSFIVEGYSRYSVRWYLPLNILGFNPINQYVQNDKPVTQINDINGDSIIYHKLTKPGNLMVVMKQPSESQKARGIQPYVNATSDYMNAASKSYDPTNNKMVDWERMTLSDVYQEQVLSHFFYRNRPDETGFDFSNLYYQLKDVTGNRFKLLQIYEYQETGKMGVPYNTKKAFPLKPVFFDEDHQMSMLQKDQYPKSVYKPGESIALLEYETSQRHSQHIMLPLLCLSALEI